MKQYPVLLTRYLYFLDETIYTLHECLINKKDFNEIVWWCGEIYYSGFHSELWDFIFAFYYNFKAIVYPKYEGKLCGLYLDFQNCANIEIILSAITMLYYLKNDDTVFKTTTNNKHRNVHIKIYTGPSPEWFKRLNIKREYKNIIRSIHAKNYDNILYYLKNTNIYDVYDIIIYYFETIYNLNLSKKSLNDVPYTNKVHIVLTMIHYLHRDADLIEKKYATVKYNHMTYCKQLDDDNMIVSPVYNTLPVRLRYPISDTIGNFPLNRYNNDYKEIYRNNWEYYAYATPLWKERFDKYNIKHNKNYIVFENDEDYEEFSRLYYYENDEQSQSIQDYSIKNIPNKLKMG
tara:strand:- start:327 stop:1364 length:1038 start_codon:yes stop_codon:yes gene_type:complete